MQAKKLQIPYGISDFKRIREEGYYYVDKTAFIRTMEQRGSFLFFVRPRRFGKSLFVDMLRYYYDVNEKENFETLFGDFAIGANPTEKANQYLVLALDFSQVNRGVGKTLAERFENYLSDVLSSFLRRYSSYLGDLFSQISPSTNAASLFNAIVLHLKELGLELYLIIDEYDNFTNEMLRAEANDAYRGITHGAGFYRNWFKAFKGNCARIFMTGVSPVTMDDLTSGFNIATNISQEEDFNAMLGFTEAETLKLYTDFKGIGKYTAGDPAEIVRTIKPHYDGYCFSEDCVGRETVFNSDMCLYYLIALVMTGRPPRKLVDVNIRTDYNKLEMIAEIQRQQCADAAEDVLPLTEALATTGEIAFDLVDSFPADEIAERENFRSLFYYYGVISMAGRREGQTLFRIPNFCVKKQLFDYIRQTYQRTHRPNWDEWSKLARSFAYRGEWKPFLERLAADYAETTPVRGGIQGEIRVQGYMQAEFGHLNCYLLAPEMELSRGFCDFCLFPERVYFGDVQHSYLIELKFASDKATAAQLDAQYDEAVAQLARYRADKAVPTLARGTTLHAIVYQFAGTRLHRLEEVGGEGRM